MLNTIIDEGFLMSENNDLSTYKNNIKEYLEVIKDVDSTKVPAKYIEKIIMHFDDESIIELSGEEFSSPFPVEGPIRWDEIKEMFSDYTKISVVLNIFMIEYDLDMMMEEFYEGLYDE